MSNIKNIEIFEVLSNSEIELIERNSAEVSFKNSEIISKQGSFTTHIMFNLKGLVKSFIENSNTKNIILEFIPENKLVSINSIFGSSIFNYSLSSSGNSTLLFIDKNILQKLIIQNGRFAAIILKKIAERDEVILNRINSLTNKQMHGRMADVLLYLSKEVYFSQEFNLTLTRKDLGEFGGMSTESSIRIIREFSNEGLININGKKISLTKIELLEKLSQLG